MQPLKIEPPKPDDGRDANGNPRGLKSLRDKFRRRFGNAVLRISGNTEQVGTGDVDQSQHNNDLLPWFVILSLVAGAALALVVRDEMTRARDMDLLGRAIKAETVAQLAPTIAKLQTDVERAKQDAAQAKDWTDQKNTELRTLRGNAK